MNPAAATPAEDRNCDGRIDAGTSEPPVVISAQAGVYFDPDEADNVWSFEATVDDPDGFEDVVAVTADVFDDAAGGLLIESFVLEATSHPSRWSSERLGSTTSLDPFWPGYTVDFVARDASEGQGSLTVIPETY